MESTEIIGIVAGICTASALLPQLVTTIRKKKAADVSVMMFLVMFAGNSLWTWYGILKKDPPIIGTNIFSVVLNLAMMFLKYKYRSNAGKDE
jgi:MtN3 and saliva related transmembrane protein